MPKGVAPTGRMNGVPGSSASEPPLTANALIALSEASTTWRSAPDGCPPRRKAQRSEADPVEPAQAAGRIQLVSCDERYVEAVVPEHNVLGSLYRAWCHRLLDDDRLGVEVLAQDHARPLGKVDVDGRNQVRLFAPGRRVVRDRLIPGDDAANVQSGRGGRNQRLSGRERDLERRAPLDQAVHDHRATARRVVPHKQEYCSRVDAVAFLNLGRAPPAKHTVAVVNVT